MISDLTIVQQLRDTHPNEEAGRGGYLEVVPSQHLQGHWVRPAAAGVHSHPKDTPQSASVFQSDVLSSCYVLQFDLFFFLLRFFDMLHHTTVVWPL